MLIIDEYDILTGTITKTAKNAQGNFFARLFRLSTDDKAIFLSQRSGVLFTENNTSGIWPTVNVYSTDATSVTGKDLIVGAPAFDGDNFYSAGCFCCTFLFPFVVCSYCVGFAMVYISDFTHKIYA